MIFIDQLIEILILAIVQGITEWLPISSSGHLVVLQKFFGLRPPIVFDVALHVGTLCVVLVAFRQDLLKILKALIQMKFETNEGKMALFMAVGSVPTGIIGYVFHDIFESLFYNLPAVGTSFIITGFFLYVSERRKGYRELNYLDSLLVGVAQGIAITPGISRSGITIATGFLRRLKRKVAFTYSFLLSIPAVTGAAIYESVNLPTSNVNAVTMLFGAVVSMIVGYVSLKLLLKVIIKGKIHLFAYYCWTVGAIVIFSLLLQPS